MVKIRDLDYEIVAKGIGFHYENNNETFKHLEKDQDYLLLKDGQFYNYLNGKFIKETISNVYIEYSDYETLLDYHCIIINTKYNGEIKINNIYYNIIEDKENKMLLIQNGIFYLFGWNNVLKSWYLYKLKNVNLKIY